MCKILFQYSREYGRDVCNLESMSQPRYCQHIANNHMESELQMVTHDFPGVLLTAGVLSPPRFMSFYAVHQVLTFIVIVEKHWSMRVLRSFLQEF